MLTYCTTPLQVYKNVIYFRLLWYAHNTNYPTSILLLAGKFVFPCCTRANFLQNQKFSKWKGHRILYINKSIFIKIFSLRIVSLMADLIKWLTFHICIWNISYSFFKEHKHIRLKRMCPNKKTFLFFRAFYLYFYKSKFLMYLLNK